MPAVTPQMLDLIIGGVGLEFIALSFVLVRLNARALIAPLGLFLASGAFLFLGARLVMAGVADGPAALSFLAAFASHIALLVWASRRLLGRSPPS
ncbi:MAG: hypothetical protein ACX939_06035 [Hyphococcus sp.]